MVASASLLAPFGLLACLLALVPVAVVALAYGRQRRVAQALGLEPISGRRAARAAVLPALACLLLGIAISTYVASEVGVSRAGLARQAST